mmetsp:Transcript_82906/g.216037  ORF Transcript_82906/g.216037 Transcript_82906/m.216037 type:complete len:245 (+) Transcript_82906:203-937(+)
MSLPRSGGTEAGVPEQGRDPRYPKPRRPGSEGPRTAPRRASEFALGGHLPLPQQQHPPLEHLRAPLGHVAAGDEAPDVVSVRAPQDRQTLVAPLQEGWQVPPEPPLLKPQPQALGGVHVEAVEGLRGGGRLLRGGGLLGLRGGGRLLGGGGLFGLLLGLGLALLEKLDLPLEELPLLLNHVASCDQIDELINLCTLQDLQGVIALLHKDRQVLLQLPLRQPLLHALEVVQGDAADRDCWWQGLR